MNGASMDAQSLRLLDQAVAAGQRVALVRTPGESDLPLAVAGSPVPIVERPLRVRRLVEAWSARESAPRKPGGARLTGIRVLAAEDNAVNRLVLQETLAAEGAQLTLVGDGRALLERVQQASSKAFDVVLTDIQMPHMDGYEAATRIRALAPDLPIIGLTARAMAEERNRCLAAGMNEHVAKPIDIDLLVSVILRYAHAGGKGKGRRAPARAAAGKRAGASRTASGIDWGALAARYPDKPWFIDQLVALARSAYADTPQKLRAAADEGDLETLAFLAHGLSGVGGNIAAPGLRDRARAAEEAARADRVNAPACGHALAAELDRVLAALDQHVPSGAQSQPHSAP
jgi:CheY-like chemotaxis protein